MQPATTRVITNAIIVSSRMRKIRAVRTMSRARAWNCLAWAVVLSKCSEIASEKTKQKNGRATDRVRLT